MNQNRRPVEDKENQFGSHNLKEFRNLDVPLQSKQLRVKPIMETFDYRYKKKEDSQQINSSISKNLTKHDTNDTKIHLSFMNPVEYNQILPQNLFQHCNSISQVDEHLLHRPQESIDHTSFFTNICEQMIEHIPSYKPNDPPGRYETCPQILIQGSELANLLHTIQAQKEEIINLKRRHLNVSCLQSKIMEETKFNSMQQLSRNQSTQAARNANLNQQVSLLQRLRQP